MESMMSESMKSMHSWLSEPATSSGMSRNCVQRRILRHVVTGSSA